MWAILSMTSYHGDPQLGCIEIIFIVALIKNTNNDFVSMIKSFSYSFTWNLKKKKFTSFPKEFFAAFHPWERKNSGNIDNLLIGEKQ